MYDHHNFDSIFLVFQQTLSTKLEFIKQKFRTYSIISFFIVVIVFCIPQLQNLQFGYKLERFFQSDDSAFVFYESYKKNFGDDNNFLMISLQTENKSIDSRFIAQLSDLTLDISKFEGIERVLSPSNAERYIKLPILGVKSSPLLRNDSSENLQTDLERIRDNNSIYNHLFSREKGALMCYIIFLPTLSPSDKMKLTQEIREKTEKIMTNSSGTYLAGQPNTQAYYMDTLRSELKLFSSITLGLLILFLTLTYRNIFVTTYAIITLVVSIVITFALVSLVNEELDFLMTLLPTIIFVIGNSTLIHLIEDYQEKDESNLMQFKTFKKQTKKITFISSLTTAIGFFSLYFLPIEPIQTFGIFAGIGIIISWLTSITLFNALMSIRTIKLTEKEEKNWKGRLETIFEKVLIRKKIIVLGSCLAFILALIGINKLTTNSYFLGDLNENSTLKQELVHFEENYGGIRPFELGISAKTGTLLTPEILGDLVNVQSYVDSTYKVAMSLSLINFLKEVNQSLNGGSPLENRIPCEIDKKSVLIDAFYQFKMSKKLSFIIDSTLCKTRITGKIADLGAQEIGKKNEALLIYLNDHDDRLEYTLTGAAHLMDDTNKQVTLNLIIGIGFSLIVVSLIIGISLRSLKIALLSILPNLYPLIIVAGIMGYMGVNLNIGTAIIFTILYGIAVDDTIHFLIRYSAEKGKTDALKHTFVNAGKKIIITSFIISSGFLALILSDFGSTFYAGLFITIGLVIALLTDLILLPLLLNKFEKTPNL